MFKAQNVPSNKFLTVGQEHLIMLIIALRPQGTAAYTIFFTVMGLQRDGCTSGNYTTQQVHKQIHVIAYCI